ncbi:unnamed protein product [Vitrella brassicaformis CCMP3155]|uniref:Uncharacterized protein n=1 Tax=Vitrella brassicaformis (strain CCMP3155) TaxID=1169540 RepID=A0A0G4G5T6_VITBC|nr:unnamed protein product [Vitrella brassicaformis CCMP3155]|eukprot:CEM23746.1 unnamed protein product [Vitrella brassicaformis CCMP3155]
MASSAQSQQLDDCLRLEDIEIGHVNGTSGATRRLAEGIAHRTFTHPQQVTQLIQDGADPDSIPRLRVCGSDARGRPYRLLSLAVDNLSDGTLSTHKADSSGPPRPVRFPHWSSRELEADIINALIDGGAAINTPLIFDEWSLPIKVAVWCGNESAVRVLLARGAAVRRHGMLAVMELPWSLYFTGRIVSPAYEERLLSIYRRLIRYDATLATEQYLNGNLIHGAARSEGGSYSQAFIDSYLELLVNNGASLTAVSGNYFTPLHEAASQGSPCVTDYLGRHLPAADINRGPTVNPNETPLVVAACNLYGLIQASQDVTEPQDARDRAIRRMPPGEATIRILLRSGADIGRMSTATEQDRRCRQLVLPQCTTVLNDIHTGAMAAVNAALAPQRSLAAFLMRSLPTLIPHLLQPPGTPLVSPSPTALPAPNGYGPHEAEAIGWRIAAMCFDQDAANEAIAANIVIRHSDMARRVCAAVDHFIKSALYASSNREVVGGTANVGGVTVRVPLQCFAIRADSRPHQVVHTRGRVGVREVVQRARLAEAARHGIEEGAINKSFNDHLGNDDCQFGGWQQLGRIDERGQWVTLGIK